MRKCKFYLITSVIFLTLLVVSLVVSGFTIDRLECNNNDIRTNAENQWRESVNTNLKFVEYGLAEAIKAGEIKEGNVGQIKNWIMKHSDILNHDYQISDFVIIELGYTLYPNDKALQLHSSDKQENEYIEKQLSELFIKIGSMKFSDNQDKYYELVSNTSSNIADNTSLDFDEVYDGIMKSMISKKSITSGSLDPNMQLPLSLKELNKIKYININNKQNWADSLVIPDGKMGFGGEPEFRDGKGNPEFTKVVLLVSVDPDKILSPYQDQIKRNDSLIKNTTYVCVTILAISVCVITIVFAHVLRINKNKGGGMNEPNTCSDDDSKLSCFAVKFFSNRNKSNR